METKNSVGVITLNRAKALNALSLNMIRAMHPQIVKWKAEGVKMILVKGKLIVIPSSMLVDVLKVRFTGSV